MAPPARPGLGARDLKFIRSGLTSTSLSIIVTLAQLALPTSNLPLSHAIMRSTLRLLANVKPRYLEPFAPTGLTGLTTHPSPRPTLIYLYTTTLQKLSNFPESSAYRQSVEALTRHRLQIVESQKPPGFEQWLERVKKTVGAQPERFAQLQRSDGTFAYVGSQQADGSDNARGEEWDGEGLSASTEGPARTPQEAAEWQKIVEESSSTANKAEADHYETQMHWENEPALEAEQ